MINRWRERRGEGDRGGEREGRKKRYLRERK